MRREDYSNCSNCSNFGGLHYHMLEADLEGLICEFLMDVVMEVVMVSGSLLRQRGRRSGKGDLGKNKLFDICSFPLPSLPDVHINN